MIMALSTTKKDSSSRKTPDQIIRKYADDYYCLELLRFFGTYPLTRFSELAVIHSLNDDGEKSRISSALGRLVIDGAVGTCIENGTHLYKLSNGESVCDSVVHLAKTDWHQWQMMIEQLKQIVTSEKVVSGDTA